MPPLVISLGCLRWFFRSVHDFVVDFFELVAAPTTETAVSTRDWANSRSHVAQAVPSNVEAETYCWCSMSSWIAVGVSREVEVDFFQFASPSALLRYCHGCQPWMSLFSTLSSRSMTVLLAC